MSDVIRCDAMTRTGRCIGHAVKRAGTIALCETHAARMKGRRAVRLHDGRQARLAFDITGQHPQVRVAWPDFGNRTTDETAAA